MAGPQPSSSEDLWGRKAYLNKKSLLFWSSTGVYALWVEVCRWLANSEVWSDDLMLKSSLLGRHNWFDSRKRFINAEAVYTARGMSSLGVFSVSHAGKLAMFQGP